MSIGSLFIISAASGTGKTSLAKALAETMPNIKISISHTTRSVRGNETPNESYFYVSEEVFISMIARNQFFEYAKVFDHYYGTSKDFVMQQLQQGFDVVLDIDWQGAEQIRSQYSECISIFLLPPSPNVLRQRLEGRKRESQEIIEKRLLLAHNEISHYKEFDYLIINDDFNMALKELQAIVQARRLLLHKQRQKHESLIQQLLNF